MRPQKFKSPRETSVGQERQEIIPAALSKPTSLTRPPPHIAPLPVHGHASSPAPPLSG